jgi:NitT/TauT family transport system permease protein
MSKPYEIAEEARNIPFGRALDPPAEAGGSRDQGEDPREPRGTLEKLPGERVGDAAGDTAKVAEPMELSTKAKFTEITESTELSKESEEPREKLVGRGLIRELLGILNRNRALISAVAALIVELSLNASGKHPKADRPYLAYFLDISILIFIFIPVFFRKRKEFLENFRRKDNFYAVSFLLLNVLNIVTSKYTILPPIFFPAPDRILSVLVEDFGYLVVVCLGSSAKLLFAGFMSGALAGLATGIAIGFSKRAAYWLNPVIKVLGPIPPTAWIPIVLVAFPTTWTAAVFLVALSVWFPTSVMTSSGILNVQNAYFEVSSALGAKRIYQIFWVGIPAAMPLIFTGLFSGACASFLTLMTAEMVGVKNGIGWYIHWQRQMLSYANVYAGLIVIAFTFYTLITLFFKFRDRMLVWQKGMIKW